MNPREGISIAILVVYGLLLLPLLFVLQKQGFFRQAGFFYLTMFALVRIAGGAVEIVSVHQPTNVDLAVWAGILTSVGLSPLMLAASGLLKRVNDLLPKPHSGAIKARILSIHILHLPILLSLILAIIGGTDLESKDADTQKTATHLLKAAGVLFLLCLIGLALLVLLTAPSIRNLPSGESKVLVAVVLSLPLLAVKTIYGLLCDFENDSTFSVFGASPWVWLGMAVIEEMLIAALFTFIGFVVPNIKVYEASGPSYRMNQVKAEQAANGNPYAQRYPQAV